MKTLKQNVFGVFALGAILAANGAIAGDEVHNGRVAAKGLVASSTTFCLTNPETKEEECVPKAEREALEKKIKELEKVHGKAEAKVPAAPVKLKK